MKYFQEKNLAFFSFIDYWLINIYFMKINDFLNFFYYWYIKMLFLLLIYKNVIFIKCFWLLGFPYIYNIFKTKILSQKKKTMKKFKYI